MIFTNKTPKTLTNDFILSKAFSDLGRKICLFLFLGLIVFSVPEISFFVLSLYFWFFICNL